MKKKQIKLVKNKFNVKNSHKKYKICKLYIKTTLNNTFITLTDLKGNVLFFYSAGKFGFKGSKKSTNYVAEYIFSYIIRNCINLKIKGLFIYINGISNRVKNSIKKIKTPKIRIFSIYNNTPIKFNGCRAPKPRRI